MIRFNLVENQINWLNAVQTAKKIGDLKGRLSSLRAQEKEANAKLAELNQRHEDYEARVAGATPLRRWEIPEEEAAKSTAVSQRRPVVARLLEHGFGTVSRRRRLTPVEAEDELVQIRLDVLRTDPAVVSAEQPPLHQEATPCTAGSTTDDEAQCAWTTRRASGRLAA